MRKKYKFLMCIMSIMMTICMLAGCAGDEKPKEIPITELIDLSPSNILQFKVGKGDGPLTIIENPEQIQEICAFLSSAFILENQYLDYTAPTDLDGGRGGDYIIIVYSDKATTHMNVTGDYTTKIAAGVDITGRTKEGEIKDKWRSYPLVNFSQQERLSEIISMSPAD
jgi:hypothetical protein